LDKNNNIDWGGWILTLIMLSAFWPVGVFLLIRQISSLGKNAKRQAKRHPYDIQREAERAAERAAEEAAAKARQSAGKKTARKKKAEPKSIPGEVSGRVLSIVGISVAGVFAIALLSTFADVLSWGWASYYLEEIFVLTGFLVGGLVCLFMGQGRRRQAKRYRKYLSYIGRNKTVSLSALASAMGKRERTVRQDLQDMLDLGIIPGYIDMASGRLILSSAGISDLEPEPEPEPEKKPQADDYEILQEIRAVNDAIPDQVMSEKIDRIGEITGKILDYQRSHPNKSGQLRSFLNYYLPTTLKVLRAYAQLDAQGIEGENITAAKKRIENMMDQVVFGFEKQLDRLFQDDAMDITSDVEVLENMLRQDGLSGTMTFGNTSTAAKSSPNTGAAAASAQQAAQELENIMKDLEDDQDQGITLQL